MKRLTLFGLLLVYVWMVAPIAAQQPVITAEYSYRRYTTQDGLPSMLFETVFKDSKGFLWQGTLSGGSSFDGFNFKPYSLEKFLNVFRIEEIEGKIRFLQYNAMFYPETQKLVHLSDTIQFNCYNSYLLPNNHYIFENPNGKKYFVKLRNDTISEVMDIPQLQGLKMCKVYLDTLQNKLYIPDNPEKKVIIYNLKNSTIQAIENVYIESFINHSRLGLLGIGSEGIYKIENDKAVLYIPLKFEMQNKIAKEMRNGDMYIKDFHNIYRISNKKVEHLYHDSSITIWDIAPDNDENIWVATNQGLYNFFHFDFKNHQIPNHFIRSVTQDDSGTYWFAGSSEDIFSLSDTIFKSVKYPLNNKLQSISFYFTFSHNNITYFLMRGGILIHENNRFYWADVPVEILYEYICAYGQNLLVVGSGKIIEITPEGKIVKTITEDDLMQSSCDRSLAVDKNNRIIAGGAKGISIIENGKTKLIKNENTAYSNIVCIDNRNHIFSAAIKYLNLVFGDSVKTVFSFDNDFIRGLLPFDNDNMLITTSKGFYIFNTKNYFEKNEIQMLFYNQNNGMIAIEPKQSKPFLDKKGNVWIVTSENVVSFDPQKLIRQIAKPSLIVQHFAVSNDNVKWETVADFVNAKFSYKDKNLKVSFIGLNYSAVENVRYHYRLIGFQNNWSEPVKNREITFNNLPHGKYQFEIYADAGTDESRCETQTYAFTITPAFWQTWWFRTLAIGVLVGCLVWIIYYYLKKKQLENIKRIEREKEMNELRVQSVRLKSIPHFNSNVLASIEYYMMTKSKEESNQLLTRYSRFTNITLHEIDKANRSLKDEIDYVRLYLELEKLRFGDKLSYAIDVDKNTDTSIMIPNMVLHTYAENAVKHGIRGKNMPGHVSIKATSEKNGVALSVEDDGIGREESRRRDPDRKGHGLGILNRQIELYNQQNADKIVQTVVDLKDADGNALGTRFEMFVPFNYKYL